MQNLIKKTWQKIKRNHLLLMVICCLIPIILIISFLPLLKGIGDYWIWLIFLLCPLLHIFMMRGHKHDNSGKHKTDNK